MLTFLLSLFVVLGVSTNPFNCVTGDAWKTTDPKMLECYTNIYTNPLQLSYLTATNTCQSLSDGVATFCYYDLYNDYPAIISRTSTVSLTPSISLVKGDDKHKRKDKREDDDDKKF